HVNDTQVTKPARIIGARRTELLSSHTCRLNGIDPEAYLRHILSILPEWPSNRVDELLPWNVVLTNK
ncbi:transposase domain-containing protein, partial [Escherichia coli]|uniref:transposase domain-containing protein n=1 Tax=Escherichia coli TaxID=562 RepID=UPI00201FD942